jgi:hypothetical protein
VSSKKSAPEATVSDVKIQEKKKFPWPTVLSWGVTGSVIVVLLLVLFQKLPFFQGTSEVLDTTPTPLSVSLPPIADPESASLVSLTRVTRLDTIIPDGARQSVVSYTTVAGDSIFSIAKQFGLDPASVLWANYDYFGDNPDTVLSIGVQLTIPPTDGILYTWKEGDNLDRIADKYFADKLKIISWPSNNLDITNPVFTPGSYVMIPDGYRALQSWVQELEYTPRSGVTKTISGPGGCAITGGYGAVGSGAFVWPSGSGASLSGWDFSSLHKGVDIADLTGDPIWAADNGTVVYAGWNDSGYGYMVMIDHNNGYQTLYAHLSSIFVTCGMNVSQGTTIGLAGESGNAFGAHLHFEIRDNGSFVNPWYVLP